MGKRFRILAAHMNVKKISAIAITIFPLSVPFGIVADSNSIQPGNYAITSETVMPHLEEMRRNKVHELRCLHKSDPGALFPILRQPAFAGCILAAETRENDQLIYKLLCETIYVATGSARLYIDGDHITGLLRVQMGGKNMTFTQRVVAQRQGPCE